MAKASSGLHPFSLATQPAPLQAWPHPWDQWWLLSHPGQQRTGEWGVVRRYCGIQRGKNRIDFQIRNSGGGQSLAQQHLEILMVTHIYNNIYEIIFHCIVSVDVYTYIYTHMQLKQKCQETTLIATLQDALETLYSLLSLKNASIGGKVQRISSINGR